MTKEEILIIDDFRLALLAEFYQILKEAKDELRLLTTEYQQLIQPEIERITEDIKLMLGGQ